MNRAASANPPRPLSGFEHLHRYWDKHDHNWVVPVLPGDLYVTKGGEVITTLLGSCVSTCLRDAHVGIAGLNHFLLPHRGRLESGDTMRYGCFAVERLIDELLKHGARRERLEIKVFGGGSVIKGMGDIGRKNIDFVHEYCESEGLTIGAEDTGGKWARRVRYYTDSGSVLIQRLKTQEEASQVVKRETELYRKLSLAPPAREEGSFEE